MEEFYFSFVSEKFQEEEESDEPKKPFAFLSELTDEQLVALLASETPRVIAITLAQLEGDKRMLVLNRIGEEEKGQVLLSIGNLEDVPLEAVVQIANKLQKKSKQLPKTVAFSRGGGKDLADLLGEMNPQEEETSSSISLAMIAIIILISILILMAIIAFMWQRSTSRRVAEIIAEQEAEQSEETPPLTVEEQSQMFASRRSNDFESIAGMSSSEIQRTSSIESSEVLDDLFSEEVEQNIPEEQTESVQRDDVKTSSSRPSTLGIEIPNMSKSPPVEEPIKELAKTIRTNCSSCNESFEVDLPSGVNSGKTACPHCGSIEFVQR